MVHDSQALRDACKWGSLYGGALVVMGIDDGGLLEQPVNENGVTVCEPALAQDYCGFDAHQ